MRRAAILLLMLAGLAPAWTESAEFDWSHIPRQTWERSLVWLSGIGIRHVTLPGGDAAGLREVIQLVRKLRLQAFLEEPVPAEMEMQRAEHGGPLTAPAGGTTRLSALRADAVGQAAELRISGKPGVVWTDVFDTLGRDGFHAGARSFSGVERAAAARLRRGAMVGGYWAAQLEGLREREGAAAPPATPGLTVRQFSAADGLSLISVSNRTGGEFRGEVRVQYPAMKRPILLPGVMVPAGDTLWLPVGVPLRAGALCRDCEAFAGGDHLIYATAELTAMEYENGILAMEFIAEKKAEVVLQLSREPAGPFVAGAHMGSMVWDDKTQRAKLDIPAGSGPAKRVRIGLAIEPPESTGFLTDARVLLIGEENRLRGQFSSPEIAGRSRLRIAPEMGVKQDPEPDARGMVYRIAVPSSAAAGDGVELSIEADGRRISHANPALMAAVEVGLPEAITVRLAEDSTLRLTPAVLPVNRRQGRDITVALRNNAPKIRTLRVTPEAAGLEFSPASKEITVGASVSRDVTFRVFAAEATEGVHEGRLRISGDAFAEEPMRLLVLGAAEQQVRSDGFEVVENARYRGIRLGMRWVGFFDKDSGRESTPAAQQDPDTSLAELARQVLSASGGKR